MARCLQALLIFLIFVNSQPASATASRRNSSRTRLLSVGVGVGSARSIAKEALEGFSETEFTTSNIVLGGGLMLFIPTDIRNGVRQTAIGFGVTAYRYTVRLKELELEFGTLELTPVMFLLKFQQFPKEKEMVGYNVEVGGGVYLSSFEKGLFTKGIEREFGVDISIENDNSPFFELGAGIDIFLSENVSISFCGTLLAGNIGTSCYASGPDSRENIEEFDKFLVSSVLYGVRVKLWL